MTPAAHGSHRARSSGGLRKISPRTSAAPARAAAPAAARAAWRARRAPRPARGACRRTRAARPRRRGGGRRWRGRVEAVGVGERGRVAVGGGDRDPHELAGGDLRPAQLGVARRVAVDGGGRRLEPQRLLDRGRQQRRVGPHRRERVRALQQVQRPRWRSCPRSSRCRRTAARRRWSASPRRSARRRRGPTAAPSCATARSASSPPPGRPALRSVTAPTIASYQREDVVDRRAAEPERVRDRRGRQRPREAAPQLTCAVRRELVRQPRGLGLDRAPPAAPAPRRAAAAPRTARGAARARRRRARACSAPPPARW